MAEALDSPIRFPVKSNAGSLPLVLPRRRTNSGRPFPTTDVAGKNQPATAVAPLVDEAERARRQEFEEKQRALQDLQIALNNRERENVEQEKRLAQREHDLVQAEGALWHAIDALQKIKSDFHARRD